MEENHIEFKRVSNGVTTIKRVNTTDLDFIQLLTVFSEFAAGCGYHPDTIRKIEYDGDSEYHSYR